MCPRAQAAPKVTNQDRRQRLGGYQTLTCRRNGSQTQAHGACSSEPCVCHLVNAGCCQVGLQAPDMFQKRFPVRESHVYCYSRGQRVPGTAAYFQQMW